MMRVQKLEQVVQKCEQFLRLQDAQIKVLQAQRMDPPGELGSSLGMGGMGSIVGIGGLGGLGGIGGMAGGMGGIGMNGMNSMGSMGSMDSMGSISDRGRSRTPPPALQGMSQYTALGGASMSIEEFATMNQLDEQCMAVLRIQPGEVQQFVISQGPAGGTNPSAIVMARIKKHGSRAVANVPEVEGFTSKKRSETEERERERPKQLPQSIVGMSQFTQLGGAAMSLEEFSLMNNLDEKCVQVLNIQPPEVQQYVISQGPAGGTNPSAIVMARIKKFGAGSSFQIPPAVTPSGFDLANVPEKVEEFIAVHALDEQCAQLLRTQTVDVQVAVLNLGPAEGRNSSAMVMGRIGKVLSQGSGSQWDVGAPGGLF